MIRKVEFRSEDDPDVAKYCHPRTVQLLQVDPGQESAYCHDLLCTVVRTVLKKLIDMRVSG